jgi:hypothetical protein
LVWLLWNQDTESGCYGYGYGCYGWMRKVMDWKDLFYFIRGRSGSIYSKIKKSKDRKLPCCVNFFFFHFFPFIEWNLNRNNKNNHLIIKVMNLSWLWQFQFQSQQI